MYARAVSAPSPSIASASAPLSAALSASGRALSAVSAIFDLANGLEDDKSLLTGLFAFELARDAGLSAADQRAAFFAGLLRHLGCTAYAAVESTLTEDDIGLRARLLRSDTSKMGEVVRAVNAGRSGLGDRLLGMARLVTNASRLRAEWPAEACGAARLLAQQLGLGEAVLLALDEVFERWDGRGGPHGKGGVDLSALGRIGTTAHLAMTFFLHGGPETAREILALRSGGVLDPDFAGRARTLIAALAEGDIESRLATLDEALSADPLTLELDTLATTFGDFADLQTPFGRGHSRRVAAAADGAAVRVGVSDDDRTALRLAAHLHDLGRVAVPTGVWLRPDWTAADRERARLHPMFTERVLSRSPALAAAARVAGAHHERLDGSGYHRGAGTKALSITARILCAAEALCTLQEERPHRPPTSPKEARRALEKEAREGRLDPDCVAALFEAPPAPRSAPRGPLDALTARERDVLVHLAHGRTNKEIAVALSISDRTVQHHTIHIYEKLGVDTRAAAALIAARHGLV